MEVSCDRAHAHTAVNADRFAHMRASRTMLSKRARNALRAHTYCV